MTITLCLKGVGVLVKIKTLSAVVAVFVVAQSVNASAIEPLNMKRITDEDKIYFGSKLDVEQIEKIQQVISHHNMSKLPCEKVSEIKKTLIFLEEVKPIFKEASTSAGISSYARKYSAALVQEFSGTSKALNEILPHYKNACVTTAATQK
jgi:hypothetical protein